jgi:hypothetical protein
MINPTAPRATVPASSHHTKAATKAALTVLPCLAMFSQPKDEAEHGRDPDLVSNWLALNQPLLARTLKACQQFHANVYARNCDKVIAAKAVQYRTRRDTQLRQKVWMLSLDILQYFATEVWNELG